MPNKTISASIHDIKSLSGDVWQVLLKPIEPYPFEAGQFAELLIDGFEYLYFTIASAPHQPLIEIHIQGGSGTNNQLIKVLRDSDFVEMAPANGRCVVSALPQSNDPLILIASGTGFSQVKAVVEDTLHSGSKRPLFIYWASYKFSHLYMLEKAENWADIHANVHMAALISEHGHWDDKNQMLIHSILADHSDLLKCQALACGSPSMVYSLLDTLIEHGLSKTQMISDVFEFSPREEK